MLYFIGCVRVPRQKNQCLVRFPGMNNNAKCRYAIEKKFCCCLSLLCFCSFRERNILWPLDCQSTSHVEISAIVNWQNVISKLVYNATNQRVVYLMVSKRATCSSSNTKMAATKHRLYHYYCVCVRSLTFWIVSKAWKVFVRLPVSFVFVVSFRSRINTMFSINCAQIQTQRCRKKKKRF